MLVNFPSTYPSGKRFVAGSARVVVQPDGKYAVALTMEDGSEYRPHENRDSAKRAQAIADDYNQIQE